MEAPRPERAALTHAGPFPMEEREAVAALVARSRDGDAHAFGQLYDRFHSEILRYLVIRVRNRDVAEDLAQQVFLKAWQAIPRYQERGLPFKAWLYRMAHNQMIDHFRTRRRTTDLADVEVSEDAIGERNLLAGERNVVLGRAMARLSEDHRRVLVLRFLMEKSAREIGEIMGRKEVTVRGLQLRALRALRSELDALGGAP